jgi:curli biogenesis system outer membrane secretion channel CsgG
VVAARYIFEVVVSEANAGASENSRRVSVGGLTVSGGSTADRIGMDVRIVDANTGLVVDAVNVVKELESSTSSVSGVGNLLGSLAGLRGKNLPVQVDSESRSSRKEGVDRALRSCIEVAVAELARRLAQE